MRPRVEEKSRSTKFRSMNKRVDVHLKMYTSVEEICKLHESVWTQIPAFAAAVNQFQTDLQKLRNDATKQESAMNGVTQLKNEKLASLFDRILFIHAALANHGRIIEDDGLRLRNKVNQTDLRRLSTVRLGFHFETLKNDLLTFGDQLGDFGVSPAVLQETVQWLDEGALISFSPRFMMNQRSQLTKSLEVQLSNLDDLLKVRIDPFVRMFKQSSPDFFSSYWTARKLVNVGGKKANPFKPSTEEPDDGN